MYSLSLSELAEDTTVASSEALSQELQAAQAAVAELDPALLHQPVEAAAKAVRDSAHAAIGRVIKPYRALDSFLARLATAKGEDTAPDSKDVLIEVGERQLRDKIAPRLGFEYLDPTPEERLPRPITGLLYGRNLRHMFGLPVTYSPLVPAGHGMAHKLGPPRTVLAPFLLDTAGYPTFLSKFTLEALGVPNPDKVNMPHEVRINGTAQEAWLGTGRRDELNVVGTAWLEKSGLVLVADVSQRAISLVESPDATDTAYWLDRMRC